MADTEEGAQDRARAAVDGPLARHLAELAATLLQTGTFAETLQRVVTARRGR